MHRSSAIILIVLMICFISVASKPAHAQEAGYSHMCYETSTPTPTINGQWSSDWTNGLQTTFGTNANFTDEWYLAATSPSVVYHYLLIETMDNTNDTRDFIQICFDGGMTADSAPSSTDFAINFSSNAVCSWYQGNGAGWTHIATPSSSIFQWNESFSTSPDCNTPHLILEMSLLKTSTDLGGTQIIGPEFWMLIQTYDAHSAGYGLQSWPTVPPSSPDVPSTYGDIPYTRESYSSGVASTSNPTQIPIAAPTPIPTPKPTSTPVSTQPPSATPRFGYEAIGKETSNLLEPKTYTLCNYTTPFYTGIITQINIYLAGIPEGSQVRAVIFANAPVDNFPQGVEPVAQSIESWTVTSGSGEWYSFTINYPALQNTVYWLGYYSENYSRYFFDADVNHVSVTSQPKDYGSQSPVAWHHQGNSIMSLYALYNATSPPANTGSNADTGSNISHFNKPTQSFQDMVFVSLIMFAEFAIVVINPKASRAKKRIPNS